MSASNKKTDKGKKTRDRKSELLIREYLRRGGRAQAAALNGAESARLSEDIFSLAQPLLDKANEVAIKKFILSLASMAWNLGALPKEEREDYLERAMDGFSLATGVPQTDVGEITYVMGYLIGRRATLFPDDSRCVLDYYLDSAGGKLTLRVTKAAKIGEASESGDESAD